MSQDPILDATVTYDDGFGNIRTTTVPLEFSPVFTVPFVISTIAIPVTPDPVTKQADYTVTVTSVDGTTLILDGLDLNFNFPELNAPP